ncbi:unnamed protein product [Arabis nemorensis]|uniref:Uncharacterized protein n=1 Tax=Arabis nemorensis TaxID=586526 RepID=A0A565CRR7_9BRAS|nr:unnamed protein product [Arabis nemorensis]
MDHDLPPLSPVTEDSREGSRVLSETLSQNPSAISALMIMIDNINRRFDDDDRRRKKKEQERESLSTAGNAGSSMSAFPVIQ